MLIFGIDPGKATGLCVWDDDTQKIMHYDTVNHGPGDFIADVDYVAMHKGVSTIVCESFIPRWGQKFELDSVYLIGALQGCYDPHMVAPSAHKSLVKDAHLNPLIKAQGFKVGAGHARDALRLCVYYSATVLRNRATLDMLAGRTHN